MKKIFLALLPDFSKKLDLAFICSTKFDIPESLSLNN